MKKQRYADCIGGGRRLLATIGALILPMMGFAERPNILFITIDDLRTELGSYGARAITPHLDKLAESGLQFNHAYTNQAVCGASRLSFMMGLYPEFTKERTYHVRNWRHRHPDVVTMNQFFLENGYKTVGTGKVYHRWQGPDVDLKNWSEYIDPQGTHYVDASSIELGKEQAAAYGKAFKRGPTTEAGVAPNAKERYFDGWRASESSRQLEKLAASKEPFFLAIGFSKPHLPFTAPVEFWDLYDREDFTWPANIGVPVGYPEYARNRKPGELGNYTDVPPGHDPQEFPPEMVQRLIHGYIASVSYTDYNIGKVLDTLERTGVAENTIIVIFGDHGYKLGDHFTWTKHTNFEIDNHVPLIIYHPTLETARGSSDALVELIDIYPTLAELSRLDAPDHLQGRSLVPILRDPSRVHRQYAYSSYPHQDGEVIGHSIRNQRYRYTEWWDAETDEVLARVATDLLRDPGETTNALIGNKALAEPFSIALKKIVANARTEQKR